jgi:acyl-CoA synthetase (AMP-forming)/AMP-acid ligase II
MKIYKSGDPDVQIPTDLSLTELLHTSARSPPLPPSQPIAQDDVEGRSLTLGQLRSTAGRLAAGLTARFRPHDQSRWATVLPNSVVFLEAVHAVLWMGCVWCPINHQLKAGEIAHALSVSKPSFVIAAPEVLDKVVDAIRLARSKSPGWESPELITAIGSPINGYANLHADFMADHPPPIPHYDDTKKRLASIHLSSGTTGNPKGVGISHYNYVANVYQTWAHDPDHWSPEHKVVAFTPFVHIANTTIPLFLGPWTGMLHVIMAAFDLEAYAGLIQQTGATAAQISPGAALAIATTDLTRRYDLSSVRRFVCGPLPLKGAEYRKFLERGNWKTVKLYGMTEAAPYVTWQKMADDAMPPTKSGSLLPNIRATLRLESGGDAPDGGPGELWLKGPNMVAGYVDNPAANQAAFDVDGWYNTGDVCTISPQGYLQVVGRTKELIKYNGFQVSPTELESYILAHGAVDDAAVGSVWDDEKMTELPTAYVVLKTHVASDSDRQITQALNEIQALVDHQVSGYKKLRGGVWQVTALPRNATFKLLRKELATHKTGLCSLASGNKASKL